MPEVINLLSSSPVKERHRGQSIEGQKGGHVRLSQSFYHDDFSDLDFENEVPLKKRKVANHVNLRTWNEGTDERHGAKFPDLSSEDEESHASGQLGLVSDGNSDLPLQVVNFDEIEFSSAPIRTTTKSKSSVGPNATLILSSDSLLDDPFEGPCDEAHHEVSAVFSERTANLLNNLVAEPLSKIKKPQPQLGAPFSKNSALKSRQTGKSDTSAIVDRIEVSSPLLPIDANNAQSDQTDAATRREKKAKEKELERERKQAEKARRAQEKQKAADLAEVNKSKTNKKDAIEEVLVEASRNLLETSVGNQLEEFYKHSEVPFSYVDEEVHVGDDYKPWQDVGAIVRWKRKVSAIYQEQTGQWATASQTRVVPEKHVLVYLKAAEFAMIVAGSAAQGHVSAPSELQMKENLDVHVATLRSRYAGCTTMYVLEGLYSWLKKNQNAKNRQYTAAVRAQRLSEGSTDIPVPSQSKAAKRKKVVATDFSFINEDTVETLLLHLQLAHQPIFIHHTISAATTAAQIFVFTQQLSTRPYRQIELEQNLKAAAFCMATGQVRTGDDPHDTYLKMLQEIQRVTPSMAYGISSEFPSVQKLAQGFRDQGNLMLEDVRKSANKDGAWSDRRLGPMVSKRLYKVFMGRDPTSTDGMS
jgi:crossover junction endonuclease EME1